MFTVAVILSDLSAQSNVGIGTATPDPSAVVDILSHEKGLLIPRMDSIERIIIPSPADGLLVYDNTTKSFWHYQHETGWVEIVSGSKSASGDVTGVFSNLQIAPGAVGTQEIAPNSITTDQIADGAVNASDLSSMGASPGNYLRWNGTVWAPAPIALPLMDPPETSYILDSDGNTNVQTEANPNEDVIRFFVAGDEVMNISKNEFGQPIFNINSESTFGSLVIGEDAGINNNPVSADEGGKNTFIGTQAGHDNGTGGSNTGIGLGAMNHNTTGSFNSAFGTHALQDNQDGVINTATGISALTFNVNGRNNTANGAYSLLTPRGYSPDSSRDVLKRAIANRRSLVFRK